MQAPAYGEIDAIIHAIHGMPFQVLGPHLTEQDGTAGLIIRAFLPQASSEATVSVEIAKPPRKRHPMRRTAPEGFFEVMIPKIRQIPDYRLIIVEPDGREISLRDPYAFEPLLTAYDLHLLGEGQHHQSYEKMGAHPCEVKGVKGVEFVVWAPNAQRVSVIGDFNQWDGRRHPMQRRSDGGIWELFIPDLGVGERYKYALVSNLQGYYTERADPYGFAAELRPGTASVVYDLGQYQWRDEDWLSARPKHQSLDAPLAIYEVHLGSWRRIPEEGQRFLTYRELAEQLPAYVREMGYTHVEFLPITEHPFDGSWGYQPVGMYAPTSRFGSPDEFRMLVDACHQAGIGVILDWVPAHFPKDGHGLVYFDGSHLYEHADPRQGEHSDWGTMIYNYGRNEVRNYLLANALFWLEKYHIDGLRVDAVASMIYLDYSREEGQWIPNRFGGRENLEAIDFVKQLNELTHHYHPGILTIAEESTAWAMVSRPTYVGGLGFSYKWNMGWMHDLLDYFQADPIYRRYRHDRITFSLMYAFSENFILPLSHDEVVHMKRSLLDKMPGDLWQKFANLRALYAFMYGHPGKKLLFMGGEFGQWHEWNYQASLDWHLLQYESHQKLQRFVQDLNQLYRSEPSLYEVDTDWQGFDWIDFRDADNSVVAFLRKARNQEDFLLFACNFTPVPRYDYRLGVPMPGLYQERLNSDSELYGGSNLGNLGGIQAEGIPSHAQPCSLTLTLPPLAVIVMKPEPRAKVEI
ncbi:MAG TPA: 1,4-alpha-glucan branching protein GlgB [Ktedonobacterales bacterium]|jgi:1,4-alpha-glucan branching enzyme